MTAPTQKVRLIVYRRDSDRCVACGSVVWLEFQHRQAVGMGGSKVKPNPADGIVLCTLCNAACEADMQTRALLCGWKVKRFTPAPVGLVPVWYPFERAWFLLNVDGSRDRLLEFEAMEYMTLAGVA